MTITVFGGSGAIGQFLVKQALKEGVTVKAYLRNPDKITFSDENLIVIKGELTDYSGIKESISGTDAVISTLGLPLARTYDGSPVLDGHVNIINAMNEKKVTRLITLATPSVKFEKDTRSFITIVPGIMARVLFPKAYKEIIRTGDIVKNSGLDWTIVRIMAPKNTPAKGIINVSFGDKKIKFAISREDIASFMLHQVNETQYIHSMPIIGS
jgi:putative NADH-flavin reductase